jgi:hypothetical protein
MKLLRGRMDGGEAMRENNPRQCWLAGFSKRDFKFKLAVSNT